MNDFFETLQALQNTPVPNLLIIGGFIFLILSFVGEVGAIIRLPKERQKWAGGFGGLLLILGVGLFMLPNQTSSNTLGDTPTSETTEDADLQTTLVPPGNTPPPNWTPTFMPEPSSSPQARRAGLTSDEVRSWCQGTACITERFEQLEESNGFINPNGIKMKTGDPVAFDIPRGISVDVWDCSQASHVTGPDYLPQVCEASFRRQP